jgi:hypothetical protein
LYRRHGLTDDLTVLAVVNDLFPRIGHRFGRADLRRRRCDYVRALLGPVGRKNGWQLAEHAGHRTPDGLQRLLNGAAWNADDVRDDLQTYVADKLGQADGALNDTGFVFKQRQLGAGSVLDSNDGISDRKLLSMKMLTPSGLVQWSRCRSSSSRCSCSRTMRSRRKWREALARVAWKSTLSCHETPRSASSRSR